jgi:hypothetical protein
MEWMIKVERDRERIIIITFIVLQSEGKIKWSVLLVSSTASSLEKKAEEHSWGMSKCKL